MFLYETPVLFQVVFSFVIGLFLGPYSNSLELLILLMVLTESLAYYTSFLYNKEFPNFLERLAINCMYLMGWVVGRWLVMGETGFEYYMDWISPKKN